MAWVLFTIITQWLDLVVELELHTQIWTDLLINNVLIRLICYTKCVDFYRILHIYFVQVNQIHYLLSCVSTINSSIPTIFQYRLVSTQAISIQSHQTSLSTSLGYHRALQTVTYYTTRSRASNFRGRRQTLIRHRTFPVWVPCLRTSSLTPSTSWQWRHGPALDPTTVARTWFHLRVLEVSRCWMWSKWLFILILSRDHTWFHKSV